MSETLFDKIEGNNNSPQNRKINSEDLWGNPIIMVEKDTKSENRENYIEDRQTGSLFGTMEGHLFYR